MAIFIRPFKKEDLTAFTSIEPLIEDFSDEFAQAIEDSNLAVTGVRNGEVIGCAGAHPVDDFHGEMWLRLSSWCEMHPIETLRWIKAGMAIIEETYPFKQLNATVKCCFEKSIRLIEYLGFTQTQTKDNWIIYSKRVQE